jgi:8-oxo-dGTP pyrophosphatase MutT (NUDIX family)
VTLAARLHARFAATAARPLTVTADNVRWYEGDWRPAAVLAAIVDRPEPTLLLTRRDERMRNHPGQVAFPGGRADPEDDGPVATALREAEEEIALPPGSVTVIGTDAPYETGSGFSITPVLGVVPPDLPLRAREIEVAEIFEVPLAFLLDPRNRIAREVEHEGLMRRYFEFVHGRHVIWGATAGMIVNLARRLGDD